MRRNRTPECHFRRWMHQQLNINLKYECSPRITSYLHNCLSTTIPPPAIFHDRSLTPRKAADILSCNEVLSWEFWDGNLVNLLSLLQGSLSKRDWNTEIVLWYSFASHSKIVWYISAMEAWCLVHWVQDTSTSLREKVRCHKGQSFASEEMPCIACTPSPLFCHGGSTRQGDVIVVNFSERVRLMQCRSLDGSRACSIWSPRILVVFKI